MNLHLLRMFMAVVEHQGFSRAAEALHVSQPAVSKAVRELEHQLGLPLVERGGARGRGVVLTDHGQSLHQHARAIFALERTAMADIRERVELRSGVLRVGASRSEEHTSELQSLMRNSYAVFCLKKKKQKTTR